MEMMAWAMAPARPVNQDVLYKCTVDLQLGQWQAFQISKGRIAGSKIVHGEFQPMGFQFGHLGDRVLEVLHQRGLREFEFLMLAGFALVRSRVSRTRATKIGLAKLLSADIHGNRSIARPIFARPGRNMLTRNPKSPMAQGKNQPGLFRQRQ